MDSIHDTFGAMYIGAMVTMAMYGLTTLQTYFYFVYYPKDSRAMKLLITVIWILDTLHIGLMCHALYHYLISGFANPAVLQDGIWSLWASIAVNTTMAFMVQCFFTKRIFHLCQPRFRWWIACPLAIIVLAHFAFGMETVGQLFVRKQFSRIHETINAAIPFAIFAVLSDILIALILCILLDSGRSDFADTNYIINNLIIVAINRCVLTSVIAVAEVIVFVVRPKTFYFLAIDFVIGKLYTNSLLATLNTRQSIRGRKEGGESTNVEVSTSLHMATATDQGNISLVRMATAESSSDDRLGTSGWESSSCSQGTTKKIGRSFLPKV